MSDFNLPSIDFLKSNALKIHQFGLGFVQVKVSDTLRYHFYHPEVMGTSFEDEVHNHRYDFTSHVLSGSLHQEIYEVIVHFAGSEVSSLVSCDPKSPAPDGRMYCDTIPLLTQTLASGSEYSLRKQTYHRVRASPYTITMLIRDTTEMEPYARVVRPRDKEAICPFNNPLTEGDCWELVSDCLYVADNKREFMPGYHMTEIPKGVLGEPSKIVEEALELQDAHNQGVRIMSAVELSDLTGAIEAYREKHLSAPITQEDLCKMSDVTKRAFINGRR